MEQEANYNVFRVGLKPRLTGVWRRAGIVLMRINGRSGDAVRPQFLKGHKHVTDGKHGHLKEEEEKEKRGRFDA